MLTKRKLDRQHEHPSKYISKLKNNNHTYCVAVFVENMNVEDIFQEVSSRKVLG